MPTVSFAAGVNSSPETVFTAFDILGSVPLTSFSSTQLVFSTGAGGTTFVVDGSGFKTDGISITAGTITQAQAYVGGALQFTLSGLSMLATTLLDAYAQEKGPSASPALENLFLPLGYTYLGNSNNDILSKTAVSPDGIPYNFTGNDKFDAGGGNDNLWLGGGDDTGLGGAGNDTFYADAGNDQLFGSTGADRLYGEDGYDILKGEAGGDRLFGGDGRDKLFGGADADTLAGGTGRDTFVFAAHDGIDRITDFSLANDRIDLPNGATFSFISVNGGADTLINYGTFGDQILLVGVAFADQGLIQFI